MDKSLLCHVQYIRELLDKQVLHHLYWIDTRDMYSDGLTKGSVERQQLHSLMDGWCEFKHDYEHWKPKKSSDSQNQNGDQRVDVLEDSSHLCLLALNSQNQNAQLRAKLRLAVEAAGSSASSENNASSFQPKIKPSNQKPSRTTLVQWYSAV